MGDDLIRLGVKGWWIVAKDKVVMEEDLEGSRGCNYRNVDEEER